VASTRPSNAAIFVVHWENYNYHPTLLASKMTLTKNVLKNIILFYYYNKFGRHIRA
jgi:hypothetical protein